MDIILTNIKEILSTSNKIIKTIEVIYFIISSVIEEPM